MRIDAVNKSVPDKHGIVLEGRAEIERCLVVGFSGNGIHVEVRVVDGTNANNWCIRNTRSIQNGGHLLGGPECREPGNGIHRSRSLSRCTCQGILGRGVGALRRSHGVEPDGRGHGRDAHRHAILTKFKTGLFPLPQ